MVEARKGQRLSRWRMSRRQGKNWEPDVGRRHAKQVKDKCLLIDERKEKTLTGGKRRKDKEKQEKRDKRQSLTCLKTGL